MSRAQAAQISQTAITNASSIIPCWVRETYTLIQCGITRSISPEIGRHKMIGIVWDVTASIDSKLASFSSIGS